MPQTDPSIPNAAGGKEGKDPSRGLIALAVVSTLIASTCCVLPLVLVLVGITGAWMVNLTALQPYTPIFTVMAIAALIWAGYLIFLKPAKACSTLDGAACGTTRRATKWIFWGCALFIAALLSFPLFAPYFY
ncbi:mercuric transporter MerT family protein [Paucimonas lemoignei]|uniref:mercuric transporter MerT family protein n=1 Tax=Paucimonas lemoignei TaxID=29443 RepID=UPI001404FB50|nr:mercuric transporter MerT family protein [Paucimonas lemoignei]